MNGSLKKSFSKVDDNVSSLSSVKGTSQLLDLFGISSAMFENRMKKFEEEYVKSDSRGRYVIELQNNDSDDVFTYETAIAMAIGYVAMKDGLFNKPFSEWPENVLTDIVNRIKLLSTYDEGSGDPDSEFPAFELMSVVGVENFKTELYSNGNFLSLPNGYEPEVMLAAFQMVYMNRASQLDDESDGNKINFANNEITEILRAIKTAIKNGNDDYEIFSNDMDTEGITEGSEFESYSNNIGYFNGNEVSMNIGNKNFRILKNTFLAEKIDYKLFNLSCSSANIVKALFFSDKLDKVRTLDLVDSGDFSLEFKVTFDPVYGLRFSPNLEHQLDFKEAFDTEAASDEEKENFKKNIGVLKLLKDSSGSEGLDDSSRLKTALLANSLEIISLKGHDFYDSLLKRVNLISSFEKNPSRLISNPIEDSLYS